jgi:F-type H+-transporting ATPase subunit epsilon
MPFDLSIVSPEGKLVECAVDSMVAPGSEGEFGVLPGHELYIIPLTAGTIRYREGSQEHEVAVTGGFVEVTQERVTVLAQVGQNQEDSG